jgi:hypothetical protein
LCVGLFDDLGGNLKEKSCIEWMIEKGMHELVKNKLKGIYLLQEFNNLGYCEGMAWSGWGCVLRLWLKSQLGLVKLD